jgi:hypothetical protein
MNTFDRMNAEFAARAAADSAAKAKGSLVGRTVKFSAADSYAYYVVKKATKANVFLEHVALGDGWKSNVVEMVGGKLPRAKVEAMLEREDRLAALFSKSAA